MYTTLYLYIHLVYLHVDKVITIVVKLKVFLVII